MRLGFAILATIFTMLGLGCGIAAAEEVPLPRPRPQAPVRFEPRPAGEPTDCDRRLEAIAVLELMAPLSGPGQCGGTDMVRLATVLMADKSRVEVRPAPILRCTMAQSLAIWVREDAAPRLATLGAALQSIENYDAFDCRGRNRVLGAKLSEHGKGNAIDVRAFTLTDGRLIGLTDTAVEKDLREGLRESACLRFTTVLGPGSDGYHEAHIHLDLAERAHEYRICQWDVREPPPAVAQIPLPLPRPAELAAISVQKL